MELSQVMGLRTSHSMLGFSHGNPKHPAVATFRVPGRVLHFITFLEEILQHLMSEAKFVEDPGFLPVFTLKPWETPEKSQLERTNGR